jgi:hypothetical protein
MKINTKTDIHPTYPLHFTYGESPFSYIQDKYYIYILLMYVFTLCTVLLTAYDAHNQLQDTKSLLLEKINCGLTNYNRRYGNGLEDAE